MRFVGPGVLVAAFVLSFDLNVAFGQTWQPPSEADRAIDNLHPRMRRDTLPPTSAFLVSRT